MARPLRIEYPGAFYHVIQRGNDRKDIFISAYDRIKFYEYLSILHTRYRVNVHAYCLMSNHYHLILETKEPNLSRALHYLNTGYTVYFNVKRKRSGHLFQGRYKAILVEADEYLHHLSRYIHLNPLRIGLVKDPADYPYSSCRYFTTLAAHPDWLDTGFILSLFDKNTGQAKSLYRKFLLDGIGNEKDIIIKNTISGLILGSRDFIDRVKEKFIKDKKDKEIPALNILQSRLKPADIKYRVAEKMGDNKLSRKISIYLIRKHTALTLREVASLFKNISDAGVSALYNRFNKNRLKDKEISDKIMEIEKMLNVET